MRFGDPSVCRDDGAEREPVDVVNLTWLERASRLDDFVACRKNCDARFREHVYVPAPDRGDGADAAGERTSPAAITRSPAAMSAAWRPTC